MKIPADPMVDQMLAEGTDVLLAVADDLAGSGFPPPTDGFVLGMRMITGATLCSAAASSPVDGHPHSLWLYLVGAEAMNGPAVEPDGCVVCEEVGPLLVAPGTSGRTWTCSACGHAWVPAVEA